MSHARQPHKPARLPQRRLRGAAPRSEHDARGARRWLDHLLRRLLGVLLLQLGQVLLGRERVRGDDRLTSNVIVRRRFFTSFAACETRETPRSRAAIHDTVTPRFEPSCERDSSNGRSRDDPTPRRPPSRRVAARASAAPTRPPPVVVDSRSVLRAALRSRSRPLSRVASRRVACAAPALDSPLARASALDPMR